jgi:hypothetical protein
MSFTCEPESQRSLITIRFMQQKEMRVCLSTAPQKNDRVRTFLLRHVAANIILQFACAIDFVVILLYMCAVHTLTHAVS